MTEQEEFEFRHRLEQEQTTTAPQPNDNPIARMMGTTHLKQTSPLDAYRDFSNEMQASGEGIAEDMGRATAGTPLEKVGPYIGGAAGTVVSMAPEIIGNMVSGPGAGVAARRTALASAENPGLLSKAGNLAARGIEKVVGIPADNITGLFNKPLELLMAPTKSKVSLAYGKSELAAAEKTLAEIVEQGTASYGAQVKRAGKMILQGEKTAEMAPQIVKGRKALDKQIAQLESQLNTAKTGKSALQDAIRSKFALRQEFNKVLDVLVPNFRQADALASRQAVVDPFRRMALPGKISITSPEGIARAIPGLPSAIGLGVSGAGAISKGMGLAAKYAKPFGLVSTPAILNQAKDE